MTKAWHPAYVLVGLLMALPLIAAVPLASPVARIAVTASPTYLYTVGILVLFAGWIGQRDGWLGLLVGWLGLSLLWTPTVGAFETAETITMSAFALLMMQALPRERHGLVVSVLVATGLFQVADGLQQFIGYDVLWHGLSPIVPIKAIFGTTGNSNYYGVYLAMIAPLAPWWAVPFFLVGILLSHSLLGVVAVSAGLLWRVRDQRWLCGGMLVAGLLAFVLVTLWKGPDAYSGLAHRLTVWRLALSHLTDVGWLIGAGPGSWATQVPALQQQAQIYPNEVFLQGHNEWLQLLYENGLLAVTCLLGWLWAHRQAWTGPYGGACLSILICSLGMFGFRLAMTGCVALVILGLATSKATNPEECAT